MIDLGTIRPGSTIRIPFSSFDKDDGSSITMTNFAAADILVYKDGSTTERASTSGYTATTDFDGKTGKHLIVLDLSDNTTAGFWNAGSEYLVAVDAVTVDAVTTGGWVARFRIGYPDAMLDTTIATLSSQTSLTLTSGPAEDDALNDQWAIIHDIASGVQCAKVLILDYAGSTKTVTLAAGATFTVAAGDNISIMGPAPLQPTVIGRRLDVSSGGEAGIDWANVGTPSSTVNLSATTVKTLTDAPGNSSGVTTLLERIVGTLATGTHQPQTGDGYALLANVTYGLSALKALIDAIGAKTTNLPSDPADASDIATAFGTVNSTLATIAAYIDTEVTAIKAKTDNLPATPASTSDIPSSAEIADAVWDEEMNGHTTDGTYGGRIVRANNSNVTVQITGAKHVAADVHELQAAVITSGDFATDAIAAACVSAGAANKIADHVRRRQQANVEASSDGDTLSVASLYGLIQQAQESNTTDTPGLLTIKKTDGSTTLGTKVLTSDPDAEPVTGVS